MKHFVADNTKTAKKQISELAGGLFNMCRNASSIIPPVAIGYIFQATGKFERALIFVEINELIVACIYCWAN